MEVDKEVGKAAAAGLPIPHDEFRKTMYRQRCLTEKPLSPAEYRTNTKDLTRESIRITDTVDTTKDDDLPPTVMAEAAWFEEVDYFDREAEANIHLEIDSLLDDDGIPAIHKATGKFKELAKRARNSLYQRDNTPRDSDSPRIPLSGSQV